jgi:hypothetical protein
MKKAMLCVSLVVACAGEPPGGVGGDEDRTACLPTDVFTALDRHLLDLASTAGALAGHPSESEVTGFLLAPGLPTPPALFASFAGPLVMTCSEPLVYDSFCEEGRCSQIECTGRGAGWGHHLWLEEPVPSDGWVIEAVDVSIVWEEAATETWFSISTTAIGPEETDMTMTGAGLMGDDALVFSEQFPGLHRAGVTRLAYTDDATGHRGQLSIDDVVVAEVDATGSLVPTGDCP